MRQATPVRAAAAPGVFECVGCTADGQRGGQCVPQSSGGGGARPAIRAGARHAGCRRPRRSASDAAECVACTDVGTSAENDAPATRRLPAPCAFHGCARGRVRRLRSRPTTTAATGDTLDQCNPATHTCVDCVASDGCGSTQVCIDGRQRLRRVQRQRGLRRRERPAPVQDQHPCASSASPARTAVPTSPCATPPTTLGGRACMNGGDCGLREPHSRHGPDHQRCARGASAAPATRPTTAAARRRTTSAIRTR